MIRLDAAAANRKADLGHGVIVYHRPVTSAVFAAAQSAMRVAAGLPVVPSASDAPITITPQLSGEMNVVFATEILALTITHWEGVGGPDGQAVEPTREWVRRLLDLEPFYKAVNERIIGPAVLLLAQKN